ncbi:MAG: undecaprenyldiphospho-muramoylpentapeptide beta-N-acetylglucosaminyltransferase [Candidatus Saccharimonadales bacterium]
MKIMLVGGGTGGHITPNLAVAHELKLLRPDCIVQYVIERGAKFNHLIDKQTDIDKIFQINAGKFRRYNDTTWLDRLLDTKTTYLNIRDFFLTLAGCWQAYQLLKHEKPNAIFIKGGFVGVPMGLCAALLKIPYITHDSDSVPGLTNRLIARWASYHATGMPAEFYPYPQSKTRYVGILLQAEYRKLTHEDQVAYRNELGLTANGKVLFVTGGSLGAQRLNVALTRFVQALIDRYPDLTVIHQVGKGNLSSYEAVKEVPSRIIVQEFFDNMYRYSGAADIIVTRGGANTLGELAMQGRTCIVVPNPLLTGGHQLKNARYYEEQGAVKVVEESDLNTKLFDMICALLDNQILSQKLAQRLSTLAKPQAARAVAQLLVDLLEK